MAYDWEEFTDYLDGTRPIRKEERDELWDALAALLERCGGRWRLNETDTAAIKDSGFLTDYTSIEESEDTDDTIKGDLAGVLIEIQDVFTGQTGYDAFKAVRADEGLDTDEKLAEIIGVAGRLPSGADDTRLWNLLKRVLDYLSCCPTALPGLEWDSVSASKTKCGDYEFGTPSTPPRVYLKRTDQNASRWDSFSHGDGYQHDGIWVHTESGIVGGSVSWGGTRTFTYDRMSCLVTASGVPASTPYRFFDSWEYHCCPDSPDCSPPSYVYTPGPLGALAWDSPPPSVSASSTVTPDVYTEFGTYDVTTPDSPTTPCLSTPGTGLEGGANYRTFTKTSTLSDEYTTALLKTDVAGAMDDFDDDWDDTAGSSSNLDGDELSYSERQSKWRVPLSGAGLTVGRTYRLYYLVRFTPASGSAEDGEEQYIEITFAEDMEHTDATDCPVPDTNGTNSIVLLRWECPEEEE